jgi:hypothetical protein
MNWAMVISGRGGSIGTFSAPAHHASAHATRATGSVTLSRKPELAPEQPLTDGINAGRKTIPLARFDKTRCAQGLESLRASASSGTRRHGRSRRRRSTTGRLTARMCGERQRENDDEVQARRLAPAGSRWVGTSGCANHDRPHRLRALLMQSVLGCNIVEVLEKRLDDAEQAENCHSWACGL